MKLPIYAYGHPLLKKESVEISAEYTELKELIANMFDTMYAAKGVGLAAPQVGHSIRLFVVDTNPYAEDYPEGKDFRKIFINPNIKEFSGEDWTFNEGCLCVPEVREDVVRPSKIHITWYDESFNFHESDFDGVISRVIQHEYDHLEGILFTDRLTSLKKIIIKRKLSEISKGQVKPAYRMVYPMAKKKLK